MRLRGAGAGRAELTPGGLVDKTPACCCGTRTRNLQVVVRPDDHSTCAGARRPPLMVTNAARFGAEKALEPLQRVNRAGTHVLGLINQVLDLSKIEAGKLDSNPQTVQLAPLIEEVIGTARLPSSGGLYFVRRRPTSRNTTSCSSRTQPPQPPSSTSVSTRSSAGGWWCGPSSRDIAVLKLDNQRSIIDVAF